MRSIQEEIRYALAAVARFHKGDRFNKSKYEQRISEGQTITYERRRMMIKQEDTWNLTVERGPACLLVTFCGEIVPVPGDLPLGVYLWQLMQRHFTDRIILDLSAVEQLTGYAVRQLIALARLVNDHDGMMRICGLSDYNLNLLRRYGQRGRLSCYGDHEEALVGRHRRCLPQACGDTPSSCDWL